MARRAGEGGWRRHVPRIFATILTLVALVSALGAVNHALRRGLRPLQEAVDSLLLPAPANLAYAAFAAILAAAVARRKRIAWWVLVVYFGLVLAAIGLLVILVATVGRSDSEDLDLSTADTVGVVVSVAFALGAMTLLLVSRKEFSAKVRHGSLRRAFGVFAALAAIGIGLGYTLVSAFPGTLQGGAGEKLAYSAEKVFGGAVHNVARQGHASGWVNLILGLFGAIALFAALFTLMRSQQAEAAMPAEDEQRIRSMLAKYGDRDSLGYFATRRDKAALFSPTGKAAVTYRVVNGVSLASADPIGDPEAWDPAIEAWLAEAREYAWTPAAMGASEEGATAYARAGLKVIHLGDEAILHPREYSLDGRHMRPVRQAVNRVERAGYTAVVRRHSAIPPEEMHAIAALATKWRDTESERGFSMALGRLGDPGDGRCVLVEAKDETGTTRSLLSFSPWGTRGLSLDLMRRDEGAENGTMEFMVSSLMAEAPRLGVDRVSLNFAVFRSVFSEGERIGAGPILRLWRRILLFFSKWWQLESLYRSNEKYEPEWVPRFLCFGERRELAKVGLASAAAEGFVTLPGTPSVGLHTAPIAALAAAAAAGEEDSAVAVEDHHPEQMKVRLAKRDELLEAGVDPYPVGRAPTTTCAAVTKAHGGLAPDTRTGEVVSIAGRVVLVRDHGQLCFATVRDWSGDLQVMLESDLDRWKSSVDIGDQVSVRGEVATTKRGELSVLAEEWAIIGKCLRPLPDKHRGLTDPEAKVRQRYLDLIVDHDARDVLRARSHAVHSLRESLVQRGFMEVETPILQRIHGGANAKPFTTHINAYDMRLYLRIAPELYLKRLVIGGVERVFELGRTFRNEGVSYKHNPEFSMLEAYQAHADYDTMLNLTREVIQEAAIAAYGTATARKSVDGNGKLEEFDISGEWPVHTVNEAISTALGEEVTADTAVEELHRLCDAHDIPYDPKWGRGAVVLEMYERLVEEKTKRPTFYKDFPTDVSPLTRQSRHDPRLAERWDLVAFGTELGTAYSELTDPVEQRRRLTEQSLLAAGGDPEAMELDEDFLQALEYAMPPTGGLGIGVDRLVMLLTGRTIRETLPFPLVRAN